jgi:hypothetical protein
MAATDWITANVADRYVIKPGSSIVSYGRECILDECPQWSYLFWQKQDDSILGAGLAADKSEWQTLGPGTGLGSNGFEQITPATSNTQLSLALVRANPKEDGLRTLSIWYRTEIGQLGQIIYDRRNHSTPYSSSPLPREDLGANTAIAGFTTGRNDTDQSVDPLGFQVLTADPDAKNGVQLTYFRDGEWTAGEEVSELKDCDAKGVMVVNQGRRIYCLVEGENGSVGITEWEWAGDPQGDVSTYTSYNRIGEVPTQA